MRKRLISIILIFILILLLTSCKTNNSLQNTVATNDEKEDDRVETKIATAFKFFSPAYSDEGSIPVKFANRGVPGGQNISIPFEWENLPRGTKSISIAIIDRHPIANNWVHWLVIDIPANAKSLPEGASGTNMPEGSIELKNTRGFPGYGGPQPPAGSGDHPYEATVYALNVEKLELSPSVSTYRDFLSAIQGKVIASSTYAGIFSR